ncbi:MAG: DNA primase [bacterium]|nr:DNA primase [bacterium]
MSRVPREVIEEVRSRTDIVQVISPYVNLRRTGKNYLGLCPFHTEKTPSFTVNPEKGIFYCFGCQAGGSVFNFLMLRENLSFPEALRLLAERAGITIPEKPRTPEEERRAQERERVHEALELAATFYHHSLLKTKEGGVARGYLDRRGVGAGSTALFRLGYAPAGWSSLLDVLRRRGFNLDDLEKAGLVVARDARHYDRFRDRLVFPITSPWGRVVGFGARALGDEEPKYLNSPETPVFSKGRLLYGLHLAREEIRSRGQAVLVEGYMDVIACRQAGLGHAVASLGTAFTREQARLLLQLCSDAVLAYDADAAGTTATLRGLGLLREVGCTVRVALLPEGRDPDDCLREMGGKAFEALLAQALPLPDYHFRLACQGADLGTVEGKLAVSRALVPVLAQIEDEVERAAYLEKFSLALGVSANALPDELRRYRRRSVKERDSRAAQGDNAGRAGQVDVARRAADELLRAMAADPALARKVAERAGLDVFEDPAHREIAAGLMRAGEGGELTPAELLESLDDPTARSVVAGAQLQEYSPEVLARVVEDCLGKLRRHRRDQRKHEIVREIGRREASGEGIPKSLLEELQDLLTEG